MSLAARAVGGAKRAARGVVGAVSPRLLRGIQLWRARWRYLREPTAGPRRLLLEPTTGCNHRCEMCWDHSPRLSKPTPACHMPFERVRGLLEEMARMGTEEVWLAGRGEPFVHPQAREILKLIGSLGMRSIITTNAGRLTEEVADRLAEWGVRQLSVSIDSGKAETYAAIHHAPPEERARILGLIRRLSQRGEGRPRLLVSMVISKPNCWEVLELVRDAVEAGADGVVIGGMRPVSFDSAGLALEEADWARVREELAKAEEVVQEAGVELRTDNIRPAEGPRSEMWPYQEMACFIGHVFSAVDAEGKVHGCCSCRNFLGSLEGSSFGEVWRSRCYRLFREACRELPTTGLTPPGCECREACGNVSDNLAIQEEVQFRFTWRQEASEFASRLDMAREMLRHLGPMLPEAEGTAEFGDVDQGEVEEETWRAVSRLHALGIMVGSVLPGGRRLFEPTRIATRGDLAEVMRRALAVCGVEAERAEDLVAESRSREGHVWEPLVKREMEEWLEGLAVRLARVEG